MQRKTVENLWIDWEFKSFEYQGIALSAKHGHCISGIKEKNSSTHLL